jgi:hypothetical protein
MMFPDPGNEKQNAALRFAAERYHAAADPQDEYERVMRNVFASMREGFKSSPAQELARYVSATEGLHFAHR